MRSVEPDAFLFLGANTPWVYAIAAALAERQHPTRVVATYDWLTYRRSRPTWPVTQTVEGLQREWWIHAPGYVGSLAPWYAPWLRRKLAQSTRALRRQDGKEQRALWVVAPYPWFLESLRDVPDERLIYYNLDDYVLYNPRRAETIAAQEAALVRRAALTICLSQQQRELLGARFPEKAADIRHFPLGVTTEYLNPAPERVPSSRTVGYVGNLIDRVDWQLVTAVAEKMPDVEFLFVGGLDGFSGGGNRPEWQRDRTRALALANVRHVGPVPQALVKERYWSFGVSWIPYATDHAFNQASCPTKVMDGLASGRPMLSTDIPECRLYPEWITIANSPLEAAEKLAQLLDKEEPVAWARAQTRFAQKHTWQERAKTMEGWL